MARYYARHYHGPAPDADNAPRLFISKLESGSVVAEIVPYVVMMGQAVPFMQQAMVISDFTGRLAKAIAAFSKGPLAKDEDRIPSKDDARDIREFVRPLTGRRGSALQISHARYERRDGQKKTVVEYRFDEAELNRAALTIDAELAKPQLAAPEDHLTTKGCTEVMMFFQQASRSTGKASGRTGDKAIVPNIWEKPLPVYFKKDAGLKEEMIGGDTNPLKDTTFIVDVDVQLIDGDPKGYLVTHVHKVIPGDN